MVALGVVVRNRPGAGLGRTVTAMGAVCSQLSLSRCGRGLTGPCSDADPFERDSEPWFGPGPHDEGHPTCSSCRLRLRGVRTETWWHRAARRAHSARSTDIALRRACAFPDGRATALCCQTYQLPPSTNG
jgi:hypothetical protein